MQEAALHEISDLDADLASGIQIAFQALGTSFSLTMLVTVALRHRLDLLANGIQWLQATARGISSLSSFGV